MNNIQTPLNNKLVIKLAEINQTLLEKTINKTSLNKECERLGMFTGISGIAMFQFYYAQFSKNDKHADIGVELINHCIENINAGYNMPTYCDGLTGFGWMLNHLKEKSFVDVDDKLLSGLEDYMCSLMMSNMNNGNYDFLHGAIGYGFYFLKRYKNTFSKKSKERYKIYLLKLIVALEVSSEKVNKKARWFSVIDYEQNVKGYSLVLSHGISSITNFLARLYVFDDFKECVESMLRESVDYMLDYLNEDTSALSLFPNHVYENKEPTWNSRVAWCHGDLGIALSLWHASKALKDTKLEKAAIDIFKKTTQRRLADDCMVIDAGVCHGSFGIAQIFNFMYMQTKMPDFREATEYWLNNGLERAFHEDGYAGYKCWQGAEKGWMNNLSLLDGIAGIGLAILSYLSEDLSDWDECLMIS